MTQFLNLKIRAKMLAGFIIIGFILFFGTAAGVYSTYSYKEGLNNLYIGRMTPALLAVNFFSSAQEVQNSLFGLVQDPASLVSFSAQAKQASQAAAGTLADLGKPLLKT